MVTPLTSFKVRAPSFTKHNHSNCKWRHLHTSIVEEDKFIIRSRLCILNIYQHPLETLDGCSEMHTLISITKRNVSPVRMFSQWHLDQLFKVPFIHHWAPRGHEFFPTDWSLMTCPSPNSAAFCYFILYIWGARGRYANAKFSISQSEEGKVYKLIVFYDRKECNWNDDFTYDARGL